MLVSGLVRLALVIGLALLPFAVAGCTDSGSPTAAVADTETQRSEQLEVTLEIAPATLVLGCPGECVTAHADIPYSAVDRTTVALSGVSPYLVKSDNRGDLVAKFTRASIESIVSPPEATLVLTGMTLAGDPFTGSDTITVQ